MMEKYVERGNVPVAVAAKVLKMDNQTVRLLLQNNIVNWGVAFKNPGSRQFSYIIYAKQFYEATGFQYSEKVEV